MPSIIQHYEGMNSIAVIGNYLPRVWYRNRWGKRINILYAYTGLMTLGIGAHKARVELVSILMLCIIEKWDVIILQVAIQNSWIFHFRLNQKNFTYLTPSANPVGISSTDLNIQ